MPPLVYEPDTFRQAIGAVIFRQSRLFIHKPDHSLPFQMKESWAKWRFFAAMRAEYRGI